MAVSFTFFTMLITRYPGPTGFSWNFSASRQREQTGKRRQRVAIIIVSFKQFQVKQTENFSASRKREQAGKWRQRVTIIIVSFKQFQVKQTEISWKSSKSGGTQPCNTHEIGFDFDASKSLGGGRYNDDCFGFHLCSELWTWMLQFDKQDL